MYIFATVLHEFVQKCGIPQVVAILPGEYEVKPLVLGVGYFQTNPYIFMCISYPHMFQSS